MKRALERGLSRRRRLRADGDRSVVPRPDARADRRRARVRRARRGRRGRPAPHEAHGLLRSPARRAARRDRRRRCASGAGRSDVRPAYKMVDTCAGEFPSATPYLYGCYDEESEAPRTGAAVGRDPRQRPESHRAGRRVRLLLRARRDRAARAGIRDDHDQLESRDRLDRLRHLRQALLRAAHARGRARDRRSRAAGRRDRAARRPDAAQAHARARGGRRDDPRHVARRDRHRRRSPALREDRARARARSSRRTARRRASTKRSRPRSAIGYPVLVRPSYVLGGRAMQIVYDDDVAARLLRDARRACPKSGRCSIDRFLEDAFECDVDAISRRQARRDRRHHAAHRGCRHSLRRFGVRAAAVSHRRERHRRRCASRPSRWRRRSASSG